MKQSKFWDYYSTFSSDERKEWIKFTKSPSHNTNPNIVKLAELFCRLPFDQDPIDKKSLYHRIYGNEQYQDIKIRKLLSASVKLIEQFWVIKKTLSTPEVFQNQLRLNLRQRGLTKLYLKKSKALIELIQADQDIHDYSLLSEIHDDISSIGTQFNKTNFVTYVKTSISLDIAQSISKRLLLALNWLQSKEFFAIDSHEQFALPSFETEPEILTSNYGFQILKRFYNLRISHDNIPESEILSLWKDFVQDHSQISKDHNYYFTVLLYNYIRNYRRISLYSKDLSIKILEFAISKNTLIHKGKGGGEAIYAYCTHLCRDEQIDIAKLLLKNYEAFLANSIKQPTMKLCNSLIYFHEGKYETCYYELLSFNISDHETCELYRRVLLLKSSIELLVIKFINSDIILAHIDNYNKYLRRKTQFDKQIIRIYLNFSAYIMRTFRLLTSPNLGNQAKERFIQEIHLSSSITKNTKDWFIQKLN